MTDETVQRMPIREHNSKICPALIMSEQFLKDYHILIDHVLCGLAEQSIPAVIVCLGALSPEDILPPTIDIIKYPFFDLPFLGSRNRRILAGQLSSLKPTVLHCFCPTMVAITKKISKDLSIPYVLSVNSIAKKISGMFLNTKRMAKVITPSLTICNSLEKKHPGLRSRLTVIHPGSFAGDRVSCFSDINKTPAIIVSGPLKKPETILPLLGAFRHLVIDGHNFLIVFTGFGDSVSQIIKHVRAAGLLAFATIIGKTRNEYTAVKGADVFVRCSASSGFDMLLLEAMGAGLVVAGCKDGIEDLIIENSTAMVFDPDDELSIYSCLEQILDQRDKARKLAQKAQNHVRENYPVSRMIDKLIEVYYQALE
ncbi:MAG: glycosyltransferase family 4 protein [Phycisphaerae bacterium]|nr:glycosyltransferase family 4 protein [Phycisphaerae bacterium]